VPIELKLIDHVPDDAPALAIGTFAVRSARNGDGEDAQGPPDDPRLLEAGFDRKALKRLGFEAKAEQVQLVGGGGPLRYALGLGDPAKFNATVLRRAAGSLARAAAKQERLVIALPDDLGLEPDAAAQAVTEGILLGSYEYLDLKSKPTPSALSRVEVAGLGKGARAGVDRGRVIADAVRATRDLVNEPGGSMTAKRLARAARRLGKAAGFDVTVLGRKEIAKAGLGGLLGVNRGSEQPPRFIELHWKPADGEARGTVALVGKGITFDTGGMSMKTAAGMMTMKNDMAGAAAVLGAFAAIARLRPSVEVRGYIPATDNMTGGDATRPGDVLRIRNGKTIEVLNTDAEGRLILADALSVASEAKPDAIIDLATLTGACVTALGSKIAGVMGNDDAWLGQVEAAAASTGEQVWRLPLPPEYRKQVDSGVADMKNVGNGQAGALVAGLILSEFVGDGIPWAHLDIAGPAFTDADDGDVTRGATGYGVRLLTELVSSFNRPG
jgi:leucyl aminopeptidase